MDEATLVGILQGDSEKEKIEVHALKRNGLSLLQLRYMTWGPGVGWFCQKSMELDEEQEGQLLQILEARRKWVTHQRKASGSNIVPFQHKTLRKTG